jgi:hypothetical protein
MFIEKIVCCVPVQDLIQKETTVSPVPDMVLSTSVTIVEKSFLALVTCGISINPTVRLR